MIVGDDTFTYEIIYLVKRWFHLEKDDSLVVIRLRIGFNFNLLIKT